MTAVNIVPVALGILATIVVVDDLIAARRRAHAQPVRTDGRVEGAS